MPFATVGTAVLLSLLGVPAAADDGPPAARWTTLTLPGGRAGLLPRLGLRADVPRALALGAVIRLVHARQRSQGPEFAALRAYLDDPPDTPDEQLPVPLTAAFWRGALASAPDADRNLLGAILSNRDAALLCYGLLAFDAESLDATAADAALLQSLLTRQAGVLAAFPGLVRLHDGALVLPGGLDAVPVWEALIEAPLTEPSTAVPALLARDGGRLAYFAATLDALDAGKRAALLGAPETPIANRLLEVRSVYDAFRDIEPGWDVGEFPFLRVGFDPALFLLQLRMGPGGRVAGSRAFWEAVFDDGAIPQTPDAALSGVEGPDVSVTWLLDQLVALKYPERQEYFRTLFFVQRALTRAPDLPRPRLVALARAFRVAPALLLSLERAGLLDGDVSLSLGRRAAALARHGGDATFREHAHGLFQGSVALVEIMTRRRALMPPVAIELLGHLSAVAPGDTRALVRVFDDHWMPALGFDGDLDGLTRESLVLEALAGTTAPVPPELRGTRVSWEGQEYRLDPAAPELVRLTDVRVQQGGNTLDAALALARVGGRLAAVTTDLELGQLVEHLRQLAAVLEPLETSEYPDRPPPPDVRAEIHRAVRDLASVDASNRARRSRTVARRLEPIERAVLADVLTSLVYATTIGDPNGRLFLAGNVARRHDYGTRDRARSVRARTPWLIPSQMSGNGAPWHVRGSLLALDVGLAELGLRRTSLDLPALRPTLSEVDKSVLLSTQALGSATAFGPAGADTVVGWLREGRRRLTSAGTVAEGHRIADRVRLDAQRRQALAWSLVEDPQAVPAMLLETELVLLGRPDGAQGPPAAWGAAQTPLTGCLCLAFPDPPALQHYLNRASSGLLASRIVDLTLVVADRLVGLDLPIALLHGTLDSALYDFLHEAQLAYPDDWWAFSAGARALSREQFVDYIAALTAGGPLVPVARPAAAANR